MFDIIIGRFEVDYNPNIFYDASCRLKEFVMNREPKRFQDLFFTTDPVPCVNPNKFWGGGPVFFDRLMLLNG